MVRNLLLLVAATPAFLPAQSTIVSPAAAATTEGTSANLFPWTANTARRYQQIHSDVGGAVRNISAVKFRVTAANATYTGTRAIDMELHMGHGVSALSPSYTFDNNYVAPKTLVLPRQVVNFGPQGTVVSPGPNPFTANMDLILPAPFAYSGNNSLVWEATIYSIVLGGTFGNPDADSSSLTTGTSTVTGLGCIATGQTAAMTHGVTVADLGGTLVLNVTVTAGPASAPCLLALGTANLNLPYPGLCSNILTDLAALVPIGGTDAGGAITTNTPTLTTFALPNNIPGATLYTQVHAGDIGRTDPIPICNSNGRTFVVPASNLTRVDEATRIFNNVGGTSATEGIFFTSTIGYSLVTQFTY